MNNSDRFRHFGTALLCSLVFLGSVYPLKAEEQAQPIEIIVPFGPGGGADQLARNMAPLLQRHLETPVVVTNVPGATGLNGIMRLLERPADGQTLAVLTADTFSLLGLEEPPWELDDVVPLAIMIRQLSGLFVAQDSRFKTWIDFEKEAKARPYRLRVAITGSGSPDDITVHYFASKDVRLDTAAFANPTERYQSILNGGTDALYEQAGDVRSFLQGGRMRPILFFSSSPPPEFKNVPTAVGRGYDITVQQFRALVVKAGTDPQRVELLTDAIDKIAAGSAYQAYLKVEYALPDSYLPAQEALAFMQKELADTRKMVEALVYMPARFRIQAEPEPCNWGATDPCLEIDLREESQ